MRESSFHSRTSVPPTVTLPELTSQKRAMRFTSVVLPDPEGPTIAQLVRAGIESETSRITGRSWAFSEEGYANVACSTLIAASGASSTVPCSSILGASSTSRTRSIEASTIGSMNASELACSIWL